MSLAHPFVVGSTADAFHATYGRITLTRPACNEINLGLVQAVSHTLYLTSMVRALELLRKKDDPCMCAHVPTYSSASQCIYPLSICKVVCLSERKVLQLVCKSNTGSSCKVLP